MSKIQNVKLEYSYLWYNNAPLATPFDSVNKQINDKERVAAAMENPDLRQIVEECVTSRTDQH